MTPAVVVPGELVKASCAAGPTVILKAVLVAAASPVAVALTV